MLAGAALQHVLEEIRNPDGQLRRVLLNSRCARARVRSLRARMRRFSRGMFF
jgi:hypothetical protein